MLAPRICILTWRSQRSGRRTISFTYRIAFAIPISLAWLRLLRVHERVRGCADILGRPLAPQRPHRLPLAHPPQPRHSRSVYTWCRPPDRGAANGREAFPLRRTCGTMRTLSTHAERGSRLGLPGSRSATLSERLARRTPLETMQVARTVSVHHLQCRGRCAVPNACLRADHAYRAPNVTRWPLPDGQDGVLRCADGFAPSMPNTRWGSQRALLSVRWMRASFSAGVMLLIASCRRGWSF